MYGDYRIDVDVDRKDSGSQHDIALKNDEHDIKIGIFSTDKDSTAFEPEKTPVRVTSDNIMTVIRGMRGKIMEIFWNIYG